MAPGFLALIEQQGRAWARELEMASECHSLLAVLTAGNHRLLVELVREAVQAGCCSPSQGLGLVLYTAPNRAARDAGLDLHGRSWIAAAGEACGAAGCDEPEMATSLSRWPLQAAFPWAAPPPGWVAWERLAVHGELALAARRVLGWLFQREHSTPALRLGRGAKP